MSATNRSAPAARAGAAAGDPEPTKLVCFELCGQAFGLPITQVKETIVLRPITRVFLTPRWLAGLVNLRGDVVPVLDLASLLGLGPLVPGDGTRIVIAQLGARRAGVLVDRLLESQVCDPARLEPPPPTLSPEAAELASGMLTLPSGAPLCVIDLLRLLQSERLTRLGQKAQG